MGCVAEYSLFSAKKRASLAADRHWAPPGLAALPNRPYRSTLSPRPPPPMNNKKPRHARSRRAFLADAASSGLLIALGQGSAARAEAPAAGAANPATPSLLPSNFSNPADSPIH